MVAEAVSCSSSTKSTRGSQEQPAEQKNNKNNNYKTDDSNQPTLEDLNVVGEMGLTPLRTCAHPMGGHPSDTSSDEHMPSPMLRLTYSNPQAAGALLAPACRPLTTQPYPATEPRMEAGFGRSTWAKTDPDQSQMMDAVEWTAIDGSQQRRIRVFDF